MYGSWTVNVVLWEKILGFNWDIKKLFNDV